MLGKKNGNECGHRIGTDCGSSTGWRLRWKVPGEGRRSCARRCAVKGHELGVSQKGGSLGIRPLVKTTCQLRLD